MILPNFLGKLHEIEKILVSWIGRGGRRQGRPSRFANALAWVSPLALADPRGAPGTRAPPGGPNSFIFMQFSAKM